MNNTNNDNNKVELNDSELEKVSGGMEIDEEVPPIKERKKYKITIGKDIVSRLFKH